jgi:hypothetical protein
MFPLELEATGGPTGSFRLGFVERAAAGRRRPDSFSDIDSSQAFAKTFARGWAADSVTICALLVAWVLRYH